MTTTAQATRCPSWCREDIHDTFDGVLIIHQRHIPTPVGDVRVVANVDDDVTGPAMVSVAVPDDDDLTPQQATAFAQALTEAVRLIG